MQTKICKICGSEYPATLEYFYAKKSNKDGLHSTCKKCKIAKVSQYYKEHTESKKIYNGEYREKNREKIKAHKKEYYTQNRHNIIIKTTQYAQANKGKKKEYMREYCKIYKLKNNEKIKEYLRQWHKSNIEVRHKKHKQNRINGKERIRDYQRNYCQTHKECYRKANQKRRSLKSQLESSYTVKQWHDALKYFQNRCAYCGKMLPLEQDHFIPLSKGGEYTVNNIVPSCKSCNSNKNDNDVFLRYPKQDFYSKKREQKILKYLNYKDGVQQLSIVI